jgi:hypothetical protein
MRVRSGARGPAGFNSEGSLSCEREAYFLYVERLAEGGNEADGPLSSR